MAVMVYANLREKERAKLQSKVRKGLDEGRSIKDIARTAGCGAEYVRQIRDGTSREPLKVDAAPIIELYERGWAVSAISLKMGLRYQTLRFRLGEAGYKLGSVTRSYRCKYSDSCFTCPLPDCKINDNVATINRLDTDFEEDL